MTEPEFNLRTLVAEVLAASTLTDPGAVAEEVYKRVPANKRATALQQAMRHFVRQVISEQRGANAKNSPPPDGGSWKVRQIREGWQKRLRDRVHVGDAEWKFLGQCTADDLRAAAAERQEMAERNATLARTYRHWASLVEESGVDTFQELPAELLMNTLGAVA